MNLLLDYFHRHCVKLRGIKHKRRACCELKWGNLFLILRFLPPSNEVCGKVMFLHASVILFTGGHTPHPTMHSPHHVHPLPCMHTSHHTPPPCMPLLATHAPPCHACPSLPHTPPLPLDAVNEREVRILLECILVLFIFVLHIRLCFMKVKRKY